MNRIRHSSGGANKRGFTLIELLFSTALGALLLTAVLATYIACGRMMESQRIRNQISGNVQVALSYLKRDIDMAGYGVASQSYQLDDWITWVNQITNPLIIKGSGTTGLTIHVTAAFNRIGALQGTVNPGDNTITVPASLVPLVTNQSKSVLFIGRSELARVTGISDTTLTISTHPTVSQGLAYSYETQAPLDLVQVITYTLKRSGNALSLIRRDQADPEGTVSYGGYTADTLVAGIQSISITRSNRIVSISVTGKADEPDANYYGPGAPYRTITLLGEVYLKNTF